MSRRKAKHPITAKRNRSRGSVRSHLTRTKHTLSEALGREAASNSKLSKDGKVRIPFVHGVSKKVRKEAFLHAAAALGKRGGAARAKNLSAKRREEIARKGGLARWKKVGKR